MSTDRFNYCPICGMRVSSDFDFCPECGFAFQAEEEDLSIDLEGILLTDCSILSQKYQCSQNVINKGVKTIMEEALTHGMKWYLLDMGTVSTGGLSWEEINDSVSEFIETKDLSPGPDLNLLILGGDDVIPIPGIEDPFPYGEGVIPSDMCYAFYGTYLQDCIDNGICDINIDNTRNVVSRIPLEEGYVETSFEEDFVAYFRRCNENSRGIPVSGAVMTSFSDWIPASLTMTQHLPLIWRDEDPELVCNRMYISPKLLTSDEESINIYKNSLGKADLLIFNLHGCDDPEYSGFYSIDEAFSPDLLPFTQARVFNTVACFGARYTGYERYESMLMRSLFASQVLLYTGSMVSVPMYSDIRGNDEARELLLNPGTGSEVFMRLYTLYQYKGLPAGRALLKAKCDYFNMCRHVESDSFSLSTILMFSLYGNPMLHFQEREDVIRAALSNGAIPAETVKSKSRTFHRKFAKTLYLKGGNLDNSLLDRVQRAVDANLSSIQRSIQSSLYDRLGLSSSMLEEISSFEERSVAGAFGYTFRYRKPDTRFAADSWIEVDKGGEIKRIYTTK